MFFFIFSHRINLRKNLWILKLNLKFDIKNKFLNTYFIICITLKSNLYAKLIYLSDY